MGFARGKHALGLCARCGWQYRLHDLVEDGHVRGLRVCVTCYDPPHPLDQVPSMDDPVALERPSPETFGGTVTITLPTYDVMTDVTSGRNEVVPLHTFRFATDTFKIALFTAAPAASYSTTNEVTGSGYTAGGVSITATQTGSDVTFSDATWASLSTEFKYGLIYRTSDNLGVADLNFGAVYRVRSGQGLTIAFPDDCVRDETYNTTAVDYDGTNDYQTRNGALIGAASNDSGTISAWVRLDGGNGDTQRIMSGNVSLAGGTRLQLDRNDTNKFYMDAYDNSPGVIVRLTSVNTYVAGAPFIHVLVSWKTSLAGSARMYINDVSDATVNIFSAGDVDYAGAGAWSIGAVIQGTALKLNGCLSELFFHNAYLDLSVASNRRLFISATGKPVSLGANGSLPFGVQPLLYVPTGDASGTGNKGTGGAFTTTGALTACSSSPSG